MYYSEIVDQVWGYCPLLLLRDLLASCFEPDGCDLVNDIRHNAPVPLHVGGNKGNYMLLCHGCTHLKNTIEKQKRDLLCTYAANWLHG